MKSLITIIAILVTGLSVLAHEGHDKTPGAITAPHGGQLKGTSQYYVELISDSSGFKLYTMDHDLKAIPIKDVKIEGSMRLPKKNQSQKLSLNTSESFLETKVDAKGSHRYIVDLKVTYKGKTESLSFNVEPQE